MRSLAAANLTETQAANLVPLLFASFAFDEGTEYFHTGIGDIVTLGQTWFGVGDFGGIEPIEEADTLSPFAVRCTLSGLNATSLTRAQNSDIYGRAMKIYIGFLVDGALVAAPDIVWSGTMDTMDVKLGEENAIALSGESDLKFFDKANNKKFNDEDQQLAFAGDLGFEYLDQMAEAEIMWRGERASVSGNPVIQPENDPFEGRGRDLG